MNRLGFKNLRPGQNYEITVRTMLESGYALPVRRIFTTRLDTPSGLTSQVIGDNSLGVILSWNKIQVECIRLLTSLIYSRVPKIWTFFHPKIRTSARNQPTLFTGPIRLWLRISDFYLKISKKKGSYFWHLTLFYMMLENHPVMRLSHSLTS